MWMPQYVKVIYVHGSLPKQCKLANVIHNLFCNLFDVVISFEFFQIRRNFNKLKLFCKCSYLSIGIDFFGKDITIDHSVEKLCTSILSTKCTCSCPQMQKSTSLVKLYFSFL